MLTQYIGGDADVAEAERHARDAVRFTYLHPLRDAAADLRQGATTGSIAVFEALRRTGTPTATRSSRSPRTRNGLLEKIDTVVTGQGRDPGRLNRMTGAGRFTQHRPRVRDPRFERVVRPFVR